METIEELKEHFKDRICINCFNAVFAQSKDDGWFLRCSKMDTNRPTDIMQCSGYKLRG
jgi:hypothetical protein